MKFSAPDLQEREYGSGEYHIYSFRIIWGQIAGLKFSLIDEAVREDHYRLTYTFLSKGKKKWQKVCGPNRFT